MKKIDIFILLLALMMFTSCNENKCKNSKSISKDTTATTKFDKKLTKFNSIESRELLSVLFDQPEFDSLGAAIWKPNYSERMIFSDYGDKNCHTNIDTIMYFIDCVKRKCAVVILTTYKFGRDCIGCDCHFCGVPIGIALLSETPDKKWKLYKFEKVFTQLGYFGTYKTGDATAGKISLKEIGDQWTCLSLKEGVGGNDGEFSGTEDFYSIEQFHVSGYGNSNHVLSNIFNFTYHYEYTSPDEKIKTKENSEIKFKKNKNNYYDINLITNKDGKLYTKKFKYSEKHERYLD